MDFSAYAMYHSIYSLKTVCPNIIVMVSNENVPVWINNLVSLVSSTRIMCGPVISFVTVKIIVHVLRRLKFRSIVSRSGKRWRGRSILTRFSDLLNNGNLQFHFPSQPSFRFLERISTNCLCCFWWGPLCQVVSTARILWRCNLFRSMEELSRLVRPVHGLLANLVLVWLRLNYS